MQPSPIVTPRSTTTLAPSQTSLPIVARSPPTLRNDWRPPASGSTTSEADAAGCQPHVAFLYWNAETLSHVVGCPVAPIRLPGPISQ